MNAGLYLHIPFCSAICPYCDFAVLTGGRQARAAFVRSLLAEIELYRHFPLSFDTIYFGGGTPSALEPGAIGRVRDALDRNLDVEDGSRIFLEANPEDLSSANLKAWRGLGVRTLSLGVQSFRDAELKVLGRRHDTEEARRGVGMALEAGFDTVSLDLIYGLPNQRLREWEENLQQAVALGPEHVSCYQLSIHEGTAFGRRHAQGRLDELSDEVQAEFFDATHRILGAAGFEAYEVSNFARGPAHRSRHNEKYWDHTPYLGLGPSAHSFHESERWWNERDLPAYEERVARGGRPVAGRETLGADELALEALMLGLRRTAGIDLSVFRCRYGVDLLERNAERIDRYRQEGFAELTDDRLWLTRRGLAIADAVARDLEL